MRMPLHHVRKLTDRALVIEVYWREKKKELIGMTITTNDGRESGHEERVHDIKSAFDILNYNQNLIQLADSKAGNLIIINSIFLASITSFVLDPKAGGSFMKGLEGVLVFCFFAATVAAVFNCLMIIMTRSDYTEKVHHPDLVFFGDIVKRTTAENYVFEFMKAKPREFLADILKRCYATAGIASRKYSHTKTAQQLTVLSSAMWLITVLMLFLR
jgi:hypothetical protein